MPIRWLDAEAQISGELGVTLSGFSASMSGAATTVVDVDGALNRALGKFVVSFDDTSHVASRNLSAIITKGSVNTYAFDETFHWWLIEHCAMLHVIQPQSIWHEVQRPARMQEWRDNYNRFPLLHYLIHDAPFHSWPCCQIVAENKYHAMNEYMVSVDRNEVLLYVDGTANLDKPNTVKENASTNVAKQTNILVNMVNATTREAMAEIRADVICGTNVSTFHTIAGQDMSDIMDVMNDGMQVVPFPKPANDLQVAYQSSTVTEIVESETDAKGEPAIIRLSTDIGLATSGALGSVSGTTVAIPAGMQAVTTVENATFVRPSGQKGIYGRQIVGYDSSEKTLFLKPFSGIYSASQAYEVAVGDKINVNEQASGSNEGDWDVDGNTEDVYEGSELLSPALADYRDRLSSKVAARSTVGATGAGWGGNISQGLVQKRSSGLPAPHPRTGVDDYPEGESFSQNFTISGGPTSFASYNGGKSTSSHIYDLTSADIEKGMEQFYFGLSHYRGKVAALRKRPTGFLPEILIWGTDYTAANSVDAAWAAWFHAVTTTEEGCHSALNQESGIGSDMPFMHEYQFLDLNTGKRDLVPFGTYDEAGSATGSSTPGGDPLYYGDFTFATPDWGERGYFRRPCDALAFAINLRDPDAGYTEFDPSWLGGTTPVATKDEITAAQWAQIQTDGYIDAGEVLKPLDMTGYVNAAVTAELRRRNPTLWNSKSYGPDQAHPADKNNYGGTYTLSDTLALLRMGSEILTDQVDGNGEIDRTASFFAAAFEVRWFSVT